MYTTDVTFYTQTYYGWEKFENTPPKRTTMYYHQNKSVIPRPEIATVYREKHDWSTFGH